MLGSKCCCKKEETPCPSYKRGGPGITISKYTMLSRSGSVVFSHRSSNGGTYRFTVYNTENEYEIYYDTGEPVSEIGSIKFFKPYGVTSVTVRVEGGPDGTVWDYSISCPGRRYTCLDTCNPNFDYYGNNETVKSISITLEAEDYKISIPRFGYQYRKQVYIDSPTNRLFNRVGKLFGYATKELDAVYPEKPFLTPVQSLAGWYYLGEETVGWEGGPQEYVLESQIHFPLGMLNGTFELEYDPTIDAWVYDFDECEYQCVSFVTGEIQNEPHIPPLRLVFSPRGCTLSIENFKYYVSVNDGDTGGCGDYVFNPYYPEQQVFKFKSVMTANFAVPRIACNTDEDKWWIGINQDIYYNIHPFCRDPGHPDSEGTGTWYGGWAWTDGSYGGIGSCSSFNPDDSDRIGHGLFAREDKIQPLPEFYAGLRPRFIENTTKNVNLGKPLIISFPFNDCRWVSNGLREEALLGWLQYSFLGCRVYYLGAEYVNSSFMYQLETYINQNPETGMKTYSYYGSNPDDDTSIPFDYPSLPAIYYVKTEQEIELWDQPNAPSFPQNVQWIKDIKTRQTIEVTGNNFQNMIIPEGKNDLILRRIDVEFADPDEEYL